MRACLVRLSGESYEPGISFPPMCLSTSYLSGQDKPGTTLGVEETTASP